MAKRFFSGKNVYKYFHVMENCTQTSLFVITNFYLMIQHNQTDGSKLLPTDQSGNHWADLCSTVNVLWLNDHDE